MALDAVIFDIDGTLVDTVAVHVKCWQRAFASCGFEVPEDRIVPEIGKGADQLVPAIVGPAAAAAYKEQLAARCTQEFLAAATRESFMLFAGATELLAELRRRRIAVAVATSGSAQTLEAIEKSTGYSIRETCDVVVTSDNAQASKPAPDIVLAAVAKLGLAPAQCVMVGDTTHDAESCRLAGVACFGVLTGTHSAAALVSAGARRVYRDVDDIRRQLTEAIRLASPGKAHLTASSLEMLMREALCVAEEGLQAGEAPIGCVLADGELRVVARAYNQFNRTQNKTAHAEMVAFAEAAGKVPAEARDLIMITTLEPCVMCTGAAMECAVDTIVYALRAPADSGTARVRSPESPESQMPRIVGGVLAQESRTLFERWLALNRGSAQAAYVEQLLSL